MDDVIERYPTSDLPLAAYLMVCGCEFEGLESAKDNRSLFVFNNVSRDALLEWQTGKARANAQAIISCYQTLKRVLHKDGKWRMENGHKRFS